MKIAIETIIREMEGKLGGYATLLLYRYANLCVKAQPMALLPVTVNDEEQGDMTIEHVAGIVMPDDYHLKVVPFDPHFTFLLCKAIAKEHPEFKQDLVKSEEGADENDSYLILTMPVVNQDRYDELNDAVNVLYDGCKAQMDKTKAEYLVKLEPKFLVISSDERDEVQEALDSSIKTHMDFIDKLKADKLTEIKDAYQAYLDKQAAKKAEADEKAAAHGHQAGQQLRLDTEE